MVSIGEGLKYSGQYCSLIEMTVYEGRILVTFKPDLEEQLIYLALRSIGKHIREQKEVAGIELFLAAGHPHPGGRAAACR